MLLNALEIKKKKILRRAIDENYFGPSYNLSVGEIVTMDGKRHEEYKLPPRGMILLTSHELFNMPKDIVGYTTVKNSLSINGIMAINIGIVDPEWDKPISSLIINFGNVDHLISKGDTFLRMTFHKFKAYEKTELSNIQNYSTNSDESDYKKYVKQRQKQSVNNLSNTFLSISQIKTEIANKVRIGFIKDILILAGTIGILGFVLTYSKEFIEYKKHAKENIYIEQIDSLGKKIEYLEGEIEKVVNIQKSQK